MKLAAFACAALCACSFSRETQKETRDELHTEQTGEVAKHEEPREVITMKFRPPSVTPGIGRKTWCGPHCGLPMKVDAAPVTFGMTGFEGAELTEVTIEKIGAVDTSTKSGTKTDAKASFYERAKTTAATQVFRIAAVLVVIALLAWAYVRKKISLP
jgi:hypothetical protein